MTVNLNAKNGFKQKNFNIDSPKPSFYSMKDDTLFDNSVLVVAHPDDEILWFSSIMERVQNIFICFLDCSFNPTTAAGRRKSLLEYPFPNVTSLNLNESEVINLGNWEKPFASRFGMRIVDSGGKVAKQYEENYHKLHEILKERLKGYRQVFTHNPWGEYGHEEHVQVYRVVKELKSELKFDLWYPAVFSNKSFNLMQRYIPYFGSGSVTLDTNVKLSDKIFDLYKKNSCWTWFNNWKYGNEESFIEDSCKKSENENIGLLVPFRFVKVRRFDNHKKRLPKFKRRINNAFHKFLKRDSDF
jgi:hypothetical protein